MFAEMNDILSSLDGVGDCRMWWVGATLTMAVRVEEYLGLIEQTSLTFWNTLKEGVDDFFKIYIEGSMESLSKVCKKNISNGSMTIEEGKIYIARYKKYLEHLCMSLALGKTKINSLRTLTKRENRLISQLA